MKVGVVTVYDSDNLGAFLQAYATLSQLKKLGHEAYVIKLRSEEERKRVYTKSIKKLKDVYTYFSKLKFNLEKFEIMKKEIDRIPYVDLNDVEKMKTLDCLILGSDEIWNIKVPVFQRSIFFGKNESDVPSIAYAVCAGHAKEADFDQMPEIMEAMKKVSFIGARDVSTKKIAEYVTKKEVTLVADPTLMVDKSVFEHETNNQIKEPYMLVYSYHVPKHIRIYIKKFAKEKNLKVISLCTKNAFCDKSINCSPLEFSSYIHDAQYVYTTTFHGTIFSMLNHKNLVVDTKNNKVLDLLKRYEMEDILINNSSIGYEEFKNQLMKNPDYDNFEKNHTLIGQQSQKFFQDSLERVGKKEN